MDTLNNNSSIKASVIVLTYNQEQTVGQTINSILSQKVNFPFEIIIGEDASPSDNTRAVCEEYATRYPSIIKLLPKAENKGLLRNYVDCLRACSGEYVACCAGDDYWCDEQKLQTQVDYLDQHLDCVMVHSDMKYFDCETGKTETPPIRKDVPEGDVRLALYGNPFVKAPTSCYRRNVVSKELIDDLYECNFMLEDMPMWMILSQKGNFHFMETHSVMYRISNNSVCNNSNLEKRIAFTNSVYDVLRYYRDKFSTDIDRSYIENRYKKEIIGIALASRQKKAIHTIIKRFGIFAILNVALKKIIQKKYTGTKKI